MITVILKCEKCGNEQDFTSEDFEDFLPCEKCGNQEEAWTFWHRPKSVAIQKLVDDEGEETWTYGGHYHNDVLVLTGPEFAKEFWSNGGHGTGYNLWVTIHYRQDKTTFTSWRLQTYGWDRCESLPSIAKKINDFLQILANEAKIE